MLILVAIVFGRAQRRFCRCPISPSAAASIAARLARSAPAGAIGTTHAPPTPAVQTFLDAFYLRVVQKPPGEVRRPSARRECGAHSGREPGHGAREKIGGL